MIQRCKVRHLFHTQPTIQTTTPTSETEWGCQVSMLILRQGKEVFEALISKGVMAGWREPNLIRVALVPLYNSFEDVWRFGEIIREIVR